MALHGTYTKEIPGFDQTLSTETYARVANVSGSKQSLDFTLEFLSVDRKSILEMRTFRFVPKVTVASENFIKQAYLHLKDLPEFADYTDC